MTSGRFSSGTRSGASCRSASTTSTASSRTHRSTRSRWHDVTSAWQSSRRLSTMKTSPGMQWAYWFSACCLFRCAACCGVKTKQKNTECLLVCLSVNLWLLSLTSVNRRWACISTRIVHICIGNTLTVTTAYTFTPCTFLPCWVVAESVLFSQQRSWKMSTSISRCTTAARLLTCRMHAQSKSARVMRFLILTSHMVRLDCGGGSLWYQGSYVGVGKSNCPQESWHVERIQRKLDDGDFVSESESKSDS